MNQYTNISTVCGLASGWYLPRCYKKTVREGCGALEAPPERPVQRREDGPGAEKHEAEHGLCVKALLERAVEVESEGEGGD